MAATKKSASSSAKKTTRKSTSTGSKRKSASSGSTTRRKTTKKPNTRKTGRQDMPEEWPYTAAGIGMLLLAAILVLALCRMDGVLLNGLLRLLGGLLGWCTQFLWVFLCFGSMCILCDMKPVRLRVLCILLFPVFLGALAHCITVHPALSLSFTTIIELWQAGQSLRMGGVIGGLLATVLTILLSETGAKLILVLVLCILLLIIFNTTPARIYMQLREFLKEDVEELREQDMTVTPAAKTTRTRTKKRKRGNIFTFLRNERAKRKAQRLRAEQELEADFADDMQEDIPSVQAQQDAVAATRERYERRLEKKRRLADVLPDTAGDIYPDQAVPHTEVPPWEQAVSAVSEPDLPEPIPEEKEPTKQEVHAQVQQEIANAMHAPVQEYLYPPIDLLKRAPRASSAGVRAELKESSERLVDTLASFGIDVQIINIVRGPSVTRFEIQIERGVKFSRITALADDIALALGADTVRIAPIPDKLAVGIEVPNKTIQMVALREVIGSKRFEQSGANLSVALGKDITGTAQVIDLAKMPHLLIAGTTGSGKSVCINSILISLLYKSSPQDVRLIMVDPKMVELGNYNGIPHLLIPVVTDPKKASGALSWAVGEMERRYALFAATGVRGLEDYNAIVRQQLELEAQQAVSHSDNEENKLRQKEVLPQIVIVIDELADLMMVAAKEVETSICRIAQKARAAGMHLVVATQRPSTDVITGLMKSNIPSRIAFAVASQVESRIILDTTGADKLIGKGDMLYSPINLNKPLRIQGCFVSTEEIERVISHVKATSSVEYSQEVIDHIERQAESDTSGEGYNGAEDEDELLPQAINIVMESGQASTSMLQRRLKLGYARAARLIDQMEQRGIVGPFEGSKPRKVLLSREDWMQMQLRQKL